MWHVEGSGSVGHRGKLQQQIEGGSGNGSHDMWTVLVMGQRGT